MNAHRWPLILCAAGALVIGCGDDDGGKDGDIDTTIEDAPEIDFVEVPLDGGAGAITDLVFVPGTDEFFLTELDGRLVHFRMDGDTTERLGEVQVPDVFVELDCGLLGVALDPDYATNGVLFVSQCTSLQGSGVFRLTMDTADYDAVAATHTEIVVAEEAEATRPWHNVGDIGFDDTGAMWALFGEKTVPENAQDPSNILGTMVRIVPDRTGDGGYTIPDDNPFVGQDGVDPAIYATGLRSPWKGHYDAQGRWWIGDVGADNFEEINLVTAPGQNFGWPEAEGPCESGCDGFTDPLTQWGHNEFDDYILDDPEALPTGGRVSWVGVDYVDTGNDPYDGVFTDRMMVGEFCVGFIRLLEADEDGQLVGDAHIGNRPHLSAWAQGPDGYLYASTFGACETVGLDGPPPSNLYRVVVR